MNPLTDPNAAAVRRRLGILGTLEALLVALLAGALGIATVARYPMTATFAVAGCLGAIGAALVTAAAWAARSTINPHRPRRAATAGPARLAAAGYRIVLLAVVAAAVVGIAIAVSGDDILTDVALIVGAVAPAAMTASTGHTITRVIRATAAS